DFPARVFVVADVNAAVAPNSSPSNLLTLPKHDLHIGLGLVNAVNVGEFQAVLAHELGHFGGLGPVAAWGRGVEATIDRWLVGPRFLKLVHRALTAVRSQLIRERELEADRIAAAVAGSNVAVSALRKTRFGAEAYALALEDLQQAAERKHYTSDLYYHQHAAAERLRRQSPV